MMSARDERIRAFGGVRGGTPRRFLVIERAFSNGSRFVLGDYLPSVLGLRGFGLPVYPFGLLWASGGFFGVSGRACLIRLEGAFFGVFAFEGYP